MKFRGRKVYGNSRNSTCPFCGRTATQKNEQGLEVCYLHIKKIMEEIKCICGSWLEFRSGKFGPYFNCMNCGNINYQKGMEMKIPTTASDGVSQQMKKAQGDSLQRGVRNTAAAPVKKEPTERVITSRDPDFFD